MLLFENIAIRVKEWRDRQEEEPDLVPRLRKVWSAPRGASPPHAAARSTATLRPQHALNSRVGL